MKLTDLTADYLRVPNATPARIPLSGPKPVAEAIDLLLVRLETDARVRAMA